MNLPEYEETIKPDNLLECDGMFYTCIVRGLRLEGEIKVVKDSASSVFLLNNVLRGALPEDNQLRGYLYSWSVIFGRDSDFEDNCINVKNFKLYKKK